MLMDMPAITMPASINTAVAAMESGVKVPDLSKVVEIIRETWDKETFDGICQGKVAVPDAVMNQYLATAIEDNAAVKELTITSLGEQKIKITALTTGVGHIVMVCNLEQFVHDKDHSLVKFKVLDKKLPDKPMMSWIFSRVSLAMATKIAGQIPAGQGLNVQITGNEVTVDFHQALYNSGLGSVELMGYRLLDCIDIQTAIPQAGYVELDMAADMPQSLRTMVGNALSGQ